MKRGLKCGNCGKPVNRVKGFCTACTQPYDYTPLPAGALIDADPDHPGTGARATQAGYARVIGEPFSDEPYGLGMQQGHPEFVAFVNGVLSQMKANGEWKADYERYLAAGLTPGQPTPDPPRSIYQTQ
jgi:hypothetical protein